MLLVQKLALFFIFTLYISNFSSAGSIGKTHCYTDCDKEEDPLLLQIRIEEQSRAEKLSNERGLQFFNKNQELKKYEKDFLVAKSRFIDGSIFGVSLEGKLFELVLKPKISECNIELSLLIQINDYKDVVYSLPSKELLSLANEICTTPFVKNRLKELYYLVRVRLAGKNYHWDTDEVIDLKAKLMKKNIKTPPPKYWTTVILDSHIKDGRLEKMLSFYFLSKSNLSVSDFSLLNDASFKEQVQKQASKFGIKNLDSAHFMFGLIKPTSIRFIPIISSKGTVQLIPYKDIK